MSPNLPPTRTSLAEANMSKPVARHQRSNSLIGHLLMRLGDSQFRLSAVGSIYTLQCTFQVTKMGHNFAQAGRVLEFLYNNGSHFRISQGLGRYCTSSEAADSSDIVTYGSITSST